MVKVSVVIVKGSIASLKTAVDFLSMGRPVAPFTGPVELTVGAVVSVAAPDGKAPYFFNCQCIACKVLATVVIVAVYVVLAVRLLNGVNVAVTPA